VGYAKQSSPTYRLICLIIKDDMPSAFHWLKAVRRFHKGFPD